MDREEIGTYGVNPDTSAGIKECFSRSNAEAAKRDEQRKRDSKLVGYVGTHGINVNDVFGQTDYKICALREILGYSGLVTGENRTSTVLEDCRPERVGIVFKKEYQAAARRLN
ncbi:hypothetical protein HY212_02965 [Candidatus Pacearchaeota archaeon]|nr:hypothetical protein [Candidatus Pacearchaeota archaeon]